MPESLACRETNLPELPRDISYEEVGSLSAQQPQSPHFPLPESRKWLPNVH
jgi:hypothetical protein